MMRNYIRFNNYLDELKNDLYSQPEDAGHTAWATDVIGEFCVREDIKSVLDVGCGQGFCGSIFSVKGIAYTGVTIGRDDFAVAIKEGRTVLLRDMSFLDFPDESFDLIFARHALEHSPFPLLTLMEWYRVSRKYLVVVAPTPEYWGVGGQNHYHVSNKEELEGLFSRSGWDIITQKDFENTHPRFIEFFMLTYPVEERKWPGPPKIIEYRFLLEKKE